MLHCTNVENGDSENILQCSFDTGNLDCEENDLGRYVCSFKVLYSSVPYVWDLPNAFIGSYLIGLGEFDFDGYNGHENYTNILWYYFFVSTFLLQIIMVNMLIAIMADTFDKVKEFEQAYFIQDAIQIWAEHISLFKPFDVNGEYQTLIIAKPVESTDGEQTEWHGKVEQIKRALKVQGNA